MSSRRSGRPPHEDALLRRARGGEEAAFGELVGSYRRELQLHCYRILGSIQDAEDLVQETMLAAWRGLDGFLGNASLRTWLYRIATNRCLNSLRDRGRRIPLGESAANAGPVPPPPTRITDPLFLQPYPEHLFEGVPDLEQAPAARYELRESIGLAFITGLQRLVPRQRVVLVLRDVLGFRAREVAEMLDLSESAVASLLHRARSAIELAAAEANREQAPLPHSPAERSLVSAFTDAFERGDVDDLVALLTEDASLTMPPQPFEYLGRAAIGRFFSTVPAAGDLRRIQLIETRANGQPAFGCYLEEDGGPSGHAYGIMVLTLGGDGLAAITGFTDPETFARFGLPATVRRRRNPPRP